MQYANGRRLLEYKPLETDGKKQGIGDLALVLIDLPIISRVIESHSYSEMFVDECEDARSTRYRPSIHAGA